MSTIMAGASGYALKQVLGSDLVDRIRRVAAGESLVAKPVIERVLDRLRSEGEVPSSFASSPSKTGTSWGSSWRV